MPKPHPQPAPVHRDDLTLIMPVSRQMSLPVAVLSKLDEGISQGHFLIGTESLAFLVHRVRWSRQGGQLRQELVIKIRAVNDRPPEGWTVVP